MTNIVPIAQRQSRLPVAGRIRTGVKGRTSGGKVKPQAIETFRFTSRHRDDIGALAALYGGTCRPWSDPKSEDRWEVITDASEIRVALPPDPLGETFYELWGGKGLERQCDGIESRCAVRGPDGLEWSPGPCLCRQRNVKECKPKLRLAVLLPSLPMRGVWRLDSKSEQALDEMPGMVATLQALQGEGLTEGLLRLERRQSQGGRNRFVVPVLGLAESLEGLIEGRARLAALPQSAGREGGIRPPALPPASPDDEVVDAELVDDDIGGNCGLDQDKGGWEPSAAEKARQLRTARSAAILNGDEPPTSWEEARDAGVLP